jgi:hypothetical protein
MIDILETCRTTLNRCVTEEVGKELSHLCAEVVGDIEKEQEKRLFCVYHHHRFGHSTFLIRSNECPSVEQAIETCEIDFEDDREDEWIDIDEISPVDIP